MAGKHPTVAAGVVHEVPIDLRKALTSDPDALAKWNALTPIARNEWICWTTSVKKAETRADHVERMRSELGEGKRRPCCWPGCPHRQERGTANKRLEQTQARRQDRRL